MLLLLLLSVDRDAVVNVDRDVIVDAVEMLLLFTEITGMLLLLLTVERDDFVVVDVDRDGIDHIYCPVAVCSGCRTSWRSSTWRT